MRLARTILLCGLLLGASTPAHAGWDWLTRCWARLGRSARYPGTSWRHFVNGAEPGRANLAEPFSLIYSTYLPVPVYFPRGNGQYEQVLSKMQTLMYRADPSTGKLPLRPDSRTNYDDYPPYMEQSIAYLRGEVEKALDRLYAEYATQGPARANEIPTYREEDRRNAGRTTHFLNGMNGEYVSHIQVLTSTSARKEPLNVESHFGALPREEGKLWVELGRLNIQQFQSLTPENAKELGDYDPKNWMRLQTWQQTYSYLAWDVRPEGVAMQVSSEVLSILEKQRFLVFDRRPVTGKYGREWVLTQTPEQIRRTEENLVREKWIRLLEHGLNDGRTDGLQYETDPNERAALARLGMLRTEGVAKTPGDDDVNARIGHLLVEGKLADGKFSPMLSTQKALHERGYMRLNFDRDYGRSLLEHLKKSRP